MANKVQTGKNFFANISYLLINMLIGIFLTPFYVNTLGVSAYAIIPLATSLIGYIGLITSSLNSAVARHLTIDVQGSDAQKANATFNSALFGLSKITIILIPAIIAISYLAPPWFGVPHNNMMDATWLFIGIGFAFLLRAWSSSFTVTFYSSNRLDIINVVNLVNLLGQVSFIAVLFSVSTPSLLGIGASYIFAALIATLLSIILYLRSNKQFSIGYRYYNSLRFKEIAQMGGWNIIDGLGSLLFINIDLIIINYLYGQTTGGEYAIALQWVTLFRNLASTFVSILGPIILISYATHQIDNIRTISKSAIKLTSVGMALPIGLLCGFAPNILSVWVGEEFAHLAPLVIILVSHLVANVAVTPLNQIFTAYNKVRAPAILTLFGGIGNILLALFLASSLGWGIYGVAVAGLISLTLKNLVFTPIYASMVMGIYLRSFYPPIIPGVISMALITFISAFLSSFISLNDLVGLIIFAGAITAGFVFFVWKFVLDDTERTIVRIPKPFGGKFS